MINYDHSSLNSGISPILPIRRKASGKGEEEILGFMDFFSSWKRCQGAAAGFALLSRHFRPASFAKSRKQ
jgi:hypothetical protein